MAHKIKGTGVAVITPFKKNKEIDFDALGKCIDYQLDNGVSFLVALGTTAEAATQDQNEKNELIDFFKEKTKGRCPLVVGIGGNNTENVIDGIGHCDFDGIDAILSVTPYYNKPTQPGLYEHFKQIAQASPVDIILYNVPGRTGINMLAETTLKLANHFENIVAVKEASGNMMQINAICKNKPEGFTVLSGDDGITLPLLSIGVEGVISVVANAFPKQFSSMVELALDGRFDEARIPHNQLFELYSLLFAEGNPGGVKAALHHLGMIENELRLPLVPVSEQLYDKISQFSDKVLR